MELGGENIIIAYAVGLVLLFMLLKVFFTPVRLAFRLLVNSVCGGIVLFVFNLAGAVIGLQIGINAVTAAVTGILGIPGIAMILLLQIVLKA